MKYTPVIKEQLAAFNVQTPLFGEFAVKFITALFAPLYGTIWAVITYGQNIAAARSAKQALDKQVLAAKKRQKEIDKDKPAT